MKLTIFFNSPEGAGWSESYFFNTPADRALDDIATRMADNRVLYLGAKCNTTFVRIKDMGAPRKVQIFSRARAGQWNDGGAVAVADSANAVVLMPYVSAAGTKRNVQVGGVPDSALIRTDDDPSFHLHPQSITYINGWYDFLLKAPYALQIKERTHVGASARFVISAITVHTNGRYKIETEGDFPAAVGGQVSFEGLKGGVNLAGLKGIRKVVDVLDTNLFTVNSGPRQDLGVPVYMGGGLVSNVVYQMTQANSTGQPYVVSTRNRGAVFTRRRGRRSNKQK